MSPRVCRVCADSPLPFSCTCSNLRHSSTLLNPSSSYMAGPPSTAQLVLLHRPDVASPSNELPTSLHFVSLRHVGHQRHCGSLQGDGRFTCTFGSEMVNRKPLSAELVGMVQCSQASCESVCTCMYVYTKYVRIYIYIYLCVCLSVCVCVCVFVGGGGGGRGGHEKGFGRKWFAATLHL